MSMHSELVAALNEMKELVFQVTQGLLDPMEKMTLVSAMLSILDGSTAEESQTIISSVAQISSDLETIYNMTSRLDDTIGEYRNRL